MSAVEETTTGGISVDKAAAPRVPVSPVTWLLNLLSSVRCGIVLLVLLVIACMMGMLIMQQNVEGFDKYFAELTPAQKLVWGRLDFFDIYHSWYFNALLLVLSLNIILASIDRFPKAWTFISRPKLDASATWLKGQEQHAVLRVQGADDAQVAGKLKTAFESVGLHSKVTRKGNRTFVFGQRGAWNRLGAYAVHVALLTVFTGGFLTAQFGRTGQMPLRPGETSAAMTQIVFDLDQPKNVAVPLPFQVTCTDIQQKLIKKEGPITADNTIDWLTRIKIRDEFGERAALVHLNEPYDYRGYRFFQASFTPIGSARVITLRVTPASGSAPQEVQIPRDGSATLADGTRLDFRQFLPDFALGQGGQPATNSGDYNNPAAVLTVTSPSGETKRAFAFTPEMQARAPFAKQPVAGYTYALSDFEKVPDGHTLSIQRDPGSRVFYTGGALLGLTLAGVFFFSHQRVWALFEEPKDGECEIVLGGNTNRNRLGFEDRFKKLVSAITGEPQPEKTDEA